MRGSPSIHLLLFIAGFAIIAMKLAEFTGGAREPQAIQGNADGQPVAGAQGRVKVDSYIRIRFSHPPTQVSLEHEGAELIPESASWTESPTDFEIEIEVGDDGNEMFLFAEWPEGTPDTALTVEIEPDGFEARSQTVWTNESELDELILFEW
jgi:hypothetical protein